MTRRSASNAGIGSLVSMLIGACLALTCSCSFAVSAQHAAGVIQLGVVDNQPPATTDELRTVDSTPEHTADIETARDVLGDQPDLPWYDAENDAIRSVGGEPRNDNTDRDSTWSHDIDTRKEKERRQISWFSDLLQAFAWSMLILLLAMLVGLLIYATKRRGSGSQSSDTPRIQKGADRFEELPFPIAHQDRDLLAAARQSAEAGNYSEAIRLLFSYELVELDKHACIELTRGKTNRQYLGELRTHPKLRELLRNTMLRFEETFFGQHQLAQGPFQDCWNQLSLFQQTLDQAHS